VRTNRDRACDLLESLFGSLFVAPPCIIWSLAQCGIVLGYSWRTWLAVAIIHSYLAHPHKVKTEPW
jgi:hypothetical protein